MVHVCVHDASKAKKDTLCEKHRVCMVTATSAPRTQSQKAKSVGVLRATGTWHAGLERCKSNGELCGDGFSGRLSQGGGVDG
jgi:hypothetical protein